MGRTGLLASLGSLDDLEPAVQAVNRCNPSAVELLDRTFLDLVALAGHEKSNCRDFHGTQAVLLIEFVSGKTRKRHWGPLEMRLTRAQPHRQPGGNRGLAGRTRADMDPASCGESHPPRVSHDRRSMQLSSRTGVFPLPRLGEYIRFLRENAEAQDLTVVIFGHAGDGNVHVNVLPELTRRGWKERVTALFEAVKMPRTCGWVGPDGERGDGGFGRDGCGGSTDRTVGLELFRGIKTQFDPQDLKPGVILSEPVSAIRQLKIGPDAEPLPDDIAAALREIERSGGYAIDRLEIADGIPGARVRRETEAVESSSSRANDEDDLPDSAPSPIQRSQVQTRVLQLQFHLPTHGHPQIPHHHPDRPAPFRRAGGVFPPYPGRASLGRRAAGRVSGRLCYMSQRDPAGRPRGSTYSNILERDTAGSSRRHLRSS